MAAPPVARHDQDAAAGRGDRLGHREGRGGWDQPDAARGLRRDVPQVLAAVAVSLLPQ
jgi:hypothetical protein